MTEKVSGASKIKSWLKDEGGAVTADWVVLTASVMLLGAATAMAVGNGTMASTTEINTYMESMDLGGYGSTGG